MFFAKQDEKSQGVYYEFDKNNSKYNITVFITLIRANQLITEFKAGGWFIIIRSEKN